MTDFANDAAVTAAGYAKTQIDRGATKSPRYITRYEKPITGQDGASGGLAKAEFGSDTSAAAADTGAVAALNGQRVVRYGKGASANLDPHGGTHTFDAT